MLRKRSPFFKPQSHSTIATTDRIPTNNMQTWTWAIGVAIGFITGTIVSIEVTIGFIANPKK